MRKSDEEIKAECAEHPEWYDGHHMTTEHPLAFDGREKKERFDYMTPEKYVECPQCKGYGGWNLTYDAYGEGEHFRASCSQCNARGYKSREFLCTQDSGLHEYKFDKNLGRCWNQYKCIHCGQIKRVDSSD